MLSKSLGHEPMMLFGQQTLLPTTASTTANTNHHHNNNNSGSPTTTSSPTTTTTNTTTTPRYIHWTPPPSSYRSTNTTPYVQPQPPTLSGWLYLFCFQQQPKDNMNTNDNDNDNHNDDNIAIVSTTTTTTTTPTINWTRDEQDILNVCFGSSFTQLWIQSSWKDETKNRPLPNTLPPITTTTNDNGSWIPVYCQFQNHQLHITTTNQTQKHTMQQTIDFAQVTSVRTQGTRLYLTTNIITTTTILLQAPSLHNANEWLFEFRNAIDSLVKHVVDQAFLDLANIHPPPLNRHHNRRMIPHPVPTPSSPLPYQSNNHNNNHTNNNNNTLLLSHGHGHVSKRRQKQTTTTTTTVSSSSPCASPVSSFAAVVVTPPELSAPPVPELDRPPTTSTTNNNNKYIPPHKRPSSQTQTPTSSNRSSGGMLSALLSSTSTLSSTTMSSPMRTPPSSTTTIQSPSLWMQLGGCADSSLGSVLDPQYIPRKSSNTLPLSSSSHPTSCIHPSNGIQVGAYSMCGHRPYNEDAFLITTHLGQVLSNQQHSQPHPWHDLENQPILVALFDGHQGNQAARYAAEKLPSFLHMELMNHYHHHDEDSAITSSREPEFVKMILTRAMARLDDAFCQLCVEDGRDWDSGTTALVAILMDDHCVVANVGDARGVFSRVVDKATAEELRSEGWLSLPVDRTEEGPYNSPVGRHLDEECMWKLITETHTPSKPGERDRIEAANGWIMEDKEIPAGQLKRIEMSDPMALDILSRSYLSDMPKAAAPQRIISIFRVCGDLSVSRALGDRLYKGAYNDPDENGEWETKELYLGYPEGHSEKFCGDLVSGVPTLSHLRVGRLASAATQEFMLIACDGLWDVMDEDDAVHVVRNLLLDTSMDVKRVAERLAEIAYHLGTSDNITVVIVVL